MRNATYEGTWEEVTAAHAAELAGHRVQITVLDPEKEPKIKGGPGSLPPAEIEKRLQAWKRFTSEPLSDVELSDYALSRESMYDDERI